LKIINKLNKLEIIAKNARIDALNMVFRAGNGNIATAFSATEVLCYLYFYYLNIRPKEPTWVNRDRFILSKGHAAPTFYSLLSQKGYFDKEELLSFRQFNSRLQPHPEYGTLEGVDFGSGSLGQGLSAGVGKALALRYKCINSCVVVMVGDGEIQEGQIWEAAMAASHFKLNQLMVIVDCNQLQAEGKIEHIMNLEPLESKWSSFGWAVRIADGHSFIDIDKNVKELISENKPGVLLSKTIKGKGISFMENSIRWHLSQGMTNDEYNQAMEEFNGQEYKIDS